MIHTYKISGMTCDSCRETVQKVLSRVEGVTGVSVDRERGEADVTMQKHIDTQTLQDALKAHPKYRLSEKEHIAVPFPGEEEKTWFQTYKPVLLIFTYIAGLTLIIQTDNETFRLMLWMNHFMGGFFLVFSFFKLLNLKGFAESYATYDILAKRWQGYGYLYAFIELMLGLAYITGFNPLVTNAVTLTVMSISLIGVLESLLNKRKIRCACLGDVFNLPMSTVTVIEDALMIAMSALMLVTLI
jgi:copper chaperone CopZ